MNEVISMSVRESFSIRETADKDLIIVYPYPLIRIHILQFLYGHHR